MPVHAAIAHALRDHGVETLYGLMGDANIFIVDYYVRKLKGRYVPAVHESGAVLMALGHASATGEVGVVTITHGPAVSNAVTALIEGTKGTIPIVLLCGDTPVEDPDHQQAISQRALIEATGAGFEQMKTPAPELGEGNTYVLRELLALPDSAILQLQNDETIGNTLKGAATPSVISLDRQVDLGWIVDRD